jgi:hypothetical protein
MRDITLVGLHHLQKGRVGDIAECYGFGSSHFEPTHTKNAGTQSSVGLSVSDDNKLLFSVNETFYAVKSGISQIRLGKFIAERTDVVEFTIGMRVAGGGNPSPTASYPLVCLYSTRPAVGTTAAPAATLLAQPAANTYPTFGYYEFTFTMMPVGTAGSKIDVYLDKVFVTSIALATNVGQTNIKDYYLTFGRMGVVCYNGTAPGSGGIETRLFTMEDIYCMYDTATADGSTRKGPMRIKPLEVDTNLDTAWQTSDGSARAACLNLPNHHGTVVTPYVLSPVSKTPMTLRRVTSPILDTDVIVAVSGVTSANRDAGNSVNLSSKWQYNGSSSASVSYLPTAGDYTTQKDVALPTLMTMPDGTALTKTRLINLEMVLTPV